MLNFHETYKISIVKTDTKINFEVTILLDMKTCLKYICLLMPNEKMTPLMTS